MEKRSKSRSLSLLISVGLTISAATMACAACGWIVLLSQREMQAPTLFGAATIAVPTGSSPIEDAAAPTPESGGRVAVMTAVSQTIEAPEPLTSDLTPTAPGGANAPGAISSSERPLSMAQSLQGVLVQTDFYSKGMTGFTGLGSNSSDVGDRIWSPNKFSIVAKRANERLENEIIGHYRDFGVEIVAQPDDKNLFYGIEFRGRTDAAANENYLFAAFPAGGHMLQKFVNGKFVEPAPVPVQESPHLIRGSSKNRLGVLAEGSTISLYINGYLVNTLKDDSLAEGTIRLVVGSLNDTPLPAKVEFSRITVMTVQRARIELPKTEDILSPALSGVLFTDDFKSAELSNEKGWAFASDPDRAFANLADGVVWTVKTKGMFVMKRPNIPSMKDFGVEVEAQADEAAGIQYGILLRFGGASPEKLSHYYFGLTADGRYFLGKEVNGKYGIAPVPGTQSPLIKAGSSPNRFGALVRGSSISLFINGTLVRTVIDKSVAEGSIGLFVMSPETGAARVTFNNMTVVTPERAAIEWKDQLADVDPAMIFQDDFGSEAVTQANGWVLAQDETRSLVWSPNNLSLVLTSAGKSLFDTPSIGFGDFGAEIEMRPGSDPGTEYGIAFRCTKDQNSCYLFSVHTDGKYGVLKKVDGQYSDPDLGDLMPSSSLNQGSASNRLGVIADGSMFYLFINGKLVRTVTDDAIAYGYVGVFVQARGEKARLDVSRMTVLTAEEALAKWLPSGILFQDDFSNEQSSRENGWVLGAGSRADYTWSPASLSMTVTERAIVGSNYPIGSYKDFGVQVEAQPADEDSEYGVYFRQSGTGNSRSRYYFGVTTAGKYYLYKMIAGQVISPAPIEDTPTTYLRMGNSKNRLGVLAEGPNISLYINGNLVTTIADSSISNGGVGVYLVSHVDRASISFSRVSVFTVERAKRELASTPVSPEPTATSGAPPIPAPTSIEDQAMAVTPSATPKPAASATPTARAAATQSGILFSDVFDSEHNSIANGWAFDQEDTWSPGKLTMTVSEKNTITWEVVPAGILGDIGVEIEAQPQVSTGVEYGIMFYLGGSTASRSYFLFGVTANGEYYLYKKVDGQWADPDPVGNTPSRYVKTGSASNRLGVLTQGGKISLYINGNLVKTVTDRSLSSGRVALFVDNVDNNQAAVEFSRVTILSPERAKVELGKR